jgi:hypothetical protein
MNSLKFLFASTFLNMNLDWNNCIANFAVSIQVPFDLA